MSAAPLLKPWRWHKLDRREVPMAAGEVADFAAEVMDTAAGVGCVLEVLHLDEMRREAETDEPEAPLFSAAQREDMLRLAIVSARRLEARAWDHIAWAEARVREHDGGGNA